MNKFLHLGKHFVSSSNSASLQSYSQTLIKSDQTKSPQNDARIDCEVTHWKRTACNATCGEGFRLKSREISVSYSSLENSNLPPKALKAKFTTFTTETSTEWRHTMSKETTTSRTLLCKLFAKRRAIVITIVICSNIR